MRGWFSHHRPFDANWGTSTTNELILLAADSAPPAQHSTADSGQHRQASEWHVRRARDVMRRAANE